MSRWVLGGGGYHIYIYICIHMCVHTYVLMYVCMSGVGRSVGLSACLSVLNDDSVLVAKRLQNWLLVLSGVCQLSSTAGFLWSRLAKPGQFCKGALAPANRSGSGLL